MGRIIAQVGKGKYIGHDTMYSTDLARWNINWNRNGYIVFWYIRILAILNM